MKDARKSVEIVDGGFITGAGDEYLTELENRRYSYQANALPPVSNPSLSDEETDFAKLSSFMTAVKRL